MGMRLREIRKHRGITQFELGKFIDIHPQRISEIEHGKGDMKLQQAIKAAQFLNVSLDELAGLN
jgi:transcriptional regulator with XRE-family HTH domain